MLEGVADMKAGGEPYTKIMATSCEVAIHVAGWHFVGPKGTVAAVSRVSGWAAGLARAGASAAVRCVASGGQ